jgi:hypothetical protein
MNEDMSKLFNFSEWLKIQEDLDPTSHFKERVEERIVDMKDILLPQQLLSRIPTPASKLKEQVKKLITDETLSRIKEMEKSSLAFDRNSGYPLIAPYFTHDGVDYPIIIVSESSDGKTGVKKEYRGNQIYVPIRDGKLLTIIPYPANMDDSEIEKRQRDHAIRSFGESGGAFKMIPKKGNYIYKLEVKDGDVVPYKIKRSAPIDYNKKQQYNLNAGRKIRVFWRGGLVECEIESVTNYLNGRYKEDGINLSLIPLEGEMEGKRIRKTLPVGSIVELPIGEDGEWVKCKVFTPGYIGDHRRAEPLNLLFKAQR